MGKINIKFREENGYIWILFKSGKTIIVSSGKDEEELKKNFIEAVEATYD